MLEDLFQECLDVIDKQPPLEMWEEVGLVVTQDMKEAAYRRNRMRKITPREMKNIESTYLASVEAALDSQLNPKPVEAPRPKEPNYYGGSNV